MATTIQAAHDRALEIPAGMDYEAFLDWLDEDTHAEWVDGQVILMSPASREHQTVAGFLFKALSEFASEREAGEVFHAPFQMKIPVRPSGREPDVLFVAKDRCHLIRDTYLDGPADLVVEVISKESRGRDTLDKREEYEQSGVREYWLVDPERRELTALRRIGTQFVEERTGRGRFESAVLPGLWLEADWLWSQPPPSLQFVLRAWRRDPAHGTSGV